MTTRELTRTDLDRRPLRSEMEIGTIWAYRSNDDPSIEQAKIIEPGFAIDRTVHVEFRNSVKAWVPIGHLRHLWSEHAEYTTAELRWFGFAQATQPTPAELDAATRVADYILDREAGFVLDGRGRGGIGITSIRRVLYLSNLRAEDFSGLGLIMEGDTTYYPWSVTKGVVIGLLLANPVHAKSIISELESEMVEAIREDVATGARLTDVLGILRGWTGSEDTPSDAAVTAQDLADFLCAFQTARSASTEPLVGDEHDQVAAHILANFTLAPR